MRRSRLITAAFLAGAALAATATPAHAQLGKLKKLGTDAIKEATKDKAAEKAGVKEPEAAKPTASASGKKADYSITAERLDVLLASLEPLVADAEKMAAGKKAEADYKAKKDAADACMQRASKMFNPMAMTMDEKKTARIEALSKQLEGVNQRSQAAMAKDDFKNAIALRDTSMVLTVMQGVMTIGANCTYPYMPAAMIDAQAAMEKNNGARSSDDSDGSGSFDPGPSARKLMSQQEFGMVRERAALWVLAQSNPSLAKGAKFTPDEESALGAKGPQLKKMGPLFESNALRWSTWGDLKRW